MTEYLKIFEASAASLRDNVLAALEGGALRTAQDGLGVYRDLLMDLANHHDRLSEELGVAPVHPRMANGYGAEWEVLVQDLYDVVTVAAQRSSSRPWIEVIDWLRSLARDGIARNYDGIYAVALALLEQMWRANLEHDAGTAPGRLAAFLLRLSELGTFTLAPLEGDRIRRDAYEARLARSFTAAIKESYETGHSTAAKLAVQYFGHTGRADRGGNFDRLRSACIVVLNAWILLRYDKGDAADPADELRTLLSSTISGEVPLLDIGMLALSERMSQEIGWSWWELEGFEPMRGGVLELSHYIVISLIQLSQQSPLRLPKTLEEDHFHLALRVREGMQDYISAGRQKVRVLDPRTDDQLASVAERFGSYIQRFEGVREERVAAMDIDPERVDRFRRAFGEALGTGSLGRSISVIPPSVRAEDETSKNFGLDSLYPKWFFAETHVHAKPEDLAKDIAGSLLRGEENRIVETLLAGVNAVDLELDALLEETAKWAQGRPEGGTFIVTNSWQAMQKLISPSEERTDESGDSARTPFGAVSYRTFDDRDPFVAMFTTPDGLSVSISPASRRVRGDSILADLNVLVGVSAVSDEDIQRIREGNEKLDEVRLRSSVRVRVLERLRVEVVDSTKRIVFGLPDDVW